MNPDYVNKLKELGFTEHVHPTYAVYTFGEQVARLWPMSVIVDISPYGSCFLVYGFMLRDFPSIEQIETFCQLYESYML